MNFLNTNQCIESCLGAFLHFVHDDCLWAFAPDRVMRWSSAKWPRDEKSDLWKPIPFVWDFGSQVIIPENWAVWLPAIVTLRKTGKKFSNEVRGRSEELIAQLMKLNEDRSRDTGRLIEGINRTTDAVEKSIAILRERNERRKGVHEPAELLFRCHLEPLERKTFVAQPVHHFRGENLVFGPRGTVAWSLLYLWGVNVGQFPQMKLGKDVHGNAVPWPATSFRETSVPFNLRFDTCAAGQSMEIDVQNQSHLKLDFEVQISGIQLVERPEG